VRAGDPRVERMVPPAADERRADEPPEHAERDGDDVRPARVVREQDFREEETDREADDCTDNACQHRHARK